MKNETTVYMVSLHKYSKIYQLVQAILKSRQVNNQNITGGEVKMPSISDWRELTPVRADYQDGFPMILDTRLQVEIEAEALRVMTESGPVIVEKV